MGLRGQIPMEEPFSMISTTVNYHILTRLLNYKSILTSSVYSHDLQNYLVVVTYSTGT